MNKETRTSWGYVLELREKLEEMCELAHRCLEVAKEKYKGYCDQKSVKEELKVRDRALILLPSDKNKMIMQWKGSSFHSTARRNELGYNLKIGGKRNVVYVSMPKRYEEREEHQQTNLRGGLIVRASDDDDANDEGDSDEVPMLALSQQHDSQDVVVSRSLNPEKKQKVGVLFAEYEVIFFF